MSRSEVICEIGWILFSIIYIATDVCVVRENAHQKLIHFNQIFREEIDETSLVNLKSISLRRTAYITRIPGLLNEAASPLRQR